MVTEREEQILGWIREDPSISQKEIAERAQISRSSVAVHISNLMRKGKILGRQYVLAENPYAVVVGGANMDIAGKPAAPLVEHDSNPGTVRLSPGGAGRNIAHNMALLGADVKLVTTFGDDDYAKILQDGCRAAGVDVSDSVTVPGAATSTYLAIMDETGDMRLAVNDMRIHDELTPDRLEPRRELLDHAAVVVADTNAPAETLAWLAENVKAPIFCDPVSTAKAKKLEGILGRLHTLKPNRYEAEVLTGIQIHDRDSLERAAKALLATGLEQVFISADVHGLYCASHTRAIVLPNFATNVVNATGAGDAMMAGIAWAYLDGANMENQALRGLAAASLTLESPATINLELSAEAVLARLGLKPAEAGK